MWFFKFGTDYLHLGSAPVSTYPCTFACWVRPTAARTAAIIWVGDAGATTNPFILYQRNIAGNMDYWAWAGGFSWAISARKVVVGELVHVAAVFYSAVERYIFIDGVLEGSSIVNGAVAAGPRTRVARNPAGGNAFDGQIGEIGIWNATLFVLEIRSLFQGVPCQRVRGGNLQMFWPLRNAYPASNDYSGNLRHIAPIGTPALAPLIHPTLTNPWAMKLFEPQKFFVVPAAAKVKAVEARVEPIVQAMI